MNLDEFSRPMEKLRSVYGDRHYPEARVLAFFEELKGTESALWQAAVKRVVLEEVYPPMMKQLRLAINQERERRYETLKVERAAEAEKFFSSGGCPKELRDQFPHLFKSIPNVRADDESEAG